MAEFFFNSIKFILAVIISPMVVACVIIGQDHFKAYPPFVVDFMGWGILTFLLIYLFVYKFTAMYALGQRLVALLFKVFAPVDRLISYMVPFYFTVIILLFYIMTFFIDPEKYLLNEYPLISIILLKRSEPHSRKSLIFLMVWSGEQVGLGRKKRRWMANN